MVYHSSGLFKQLSLKQYSLKIYICWIFKPNFLLCKGSSDILAYASARNSLMRVLFRLFPLREEVVS